MGIVRVSEKKNVSVNIINPLILYCFKQFVIREKQHPKFRIFFFLNDFSISGITIIISFCSYLCLLI